MPLIPTLLILLQAQGTTPPPSQEKVGTPDSGDILRNVADKLVGLQTVKGKFQLSLHNEPIQNGEFKFKKPDFFAVTGVDIAQFYNGKTFVQWDKPNRIYERRTSYRLASVPYVTGYEAFFGLISGLVPTGIEEVKISGKDAWAILVEPPKDVKTHKIFVEKSTSLPLGWSMLFSDGRQASVKITTQETDTTIPETDFEFEMPKDAKSAEQVALTDNLLPLGTQLPDFAADKHSGGQLKFSDYAAKKKATLLIFWFADCEACKNAIPEMRAKIVPLAPQGLGAISFNLGDSKDAIDKKAKEWKLDMHHLMLEPTGNIVKLFKVVAYPTFYLVGPDGKVWMRSVGYDRQALESGLKALGFKV